MADDLISSMEKHKLHMEAHIRKVSAARNTKIIDPIKYRNMQAYLKNKKMDLTTLGIPKHVIPKFKHNVFKKKYKVLPFPKMGLVDVICVPAKVDVSMKSFLQIFIIG